jgi:hypothetical protein
MQKQEEKLNYAPFCSTNILFELPKNPFEGY